MLARLQRMSGRPNVMGLLLSDFTLPDGEITPSTGDANAGMRHSENHQPQLSGRHANPEIRCVRPGAGTTEVSRPRELG